MSKKILVIDDETSILDILAGILSDEGFAPICVDSAEKGLEQLKTEAVDLVLLDIWMPGMDGLEALKQIKEDYPELQVIMISGHGTIETAVQATKIGAFDFIEKPLSYDKIVLAIKNGLRFSRLETDNLILRQKANHKPSLTGNSPAIKNLREQIERVAPTDAWVLIRGEHGTGKELVAQAIHRLSESNTKPMVEVNCAAIPEELIESELFGHEKGSFTGAQTSKRGKFDQADGGMLFLDTYERHLLDAQERTMAQEGRLLAAAIEARDRVSGEDARRILVQLDQRQLARLRVVNTAGEVVADSTGHLGDDIGCCRSHNNQVRRLCQADMPGLIHITVIEKISIDLSA